MRIVGSFARVPLQLAVLMMGAVACLSLVVAQDSGEYVPKSGQSGKDVIWLPTETPIVSEMLNIAKMTPDDFVIDLGSGDGRTVIAAAKRGAKSKGIEFNPKLVEFARKRAQEAGVSDKTEFVQGDIFKTDFSNATVLTMFLLPSINEQLMPQILKMKPGTRIVTNTFTMGDWKADASSEVKEGCRQYCTAHLWYVPADLAGTWSGEDGTLELRQSYQMLSGGLQNGADVAKLMGGKVKGTEFEFQIGSTTYKGRIEGDALVGTKQAAGGEPTAWRVTRKKS
ncbi:MAG: hypothetical protein RLZ98_3426 [Pseudomonadota bacterium]|jgi:SAM-dependent methyltransferase